MAPGKFIVFEGLDRSGKSTQVKLLSSRLSNSETIAFPNRSTPIGQMINSYLSSKQDIDDHSIHLLFSANRWEARQNILNLLQAGTNVVCDRYTFSGQAFSMANGLDQAWCVSADIGLPQPDLVLFLSVSDEVQKQRGGFGGERYETTDMQRRVAHAFERIGSQEGQKWNVVNADKSVQEVSEVIWAIVEKAL